MTRESDAYKYCGNPNCGCRNVEANFRCWYHIEQDKAEKRRIVSLNNIYVSAKKLLEEIEKEVELCTGS